MKAFKCAVTGDTQPKVNNYPIATSTDIVAGQPVLLSGGVVTTIGADATTAILGVAAAVHKGKSESIYPVDYADEIAVYDNPAQIFESNAPIITATGGTATTIVATGIDAFANDAFNGGKVKLIEKASDSTNTDPVGIVYNITDYVAADKTITINAAGGAVTAGDKFEVYPPFMFATMGLDTSKQDIVLTDDDTTVFKVVGFDLNRSKVRLMANLHQMANKQA